MALEDKRRTKGFALFSDFVGKAARNLGIKHPMRVL